jgi:hypothetical protein
LGNLAHEDDLGWFIISRAAEKPKLSNLRKIKMIEEVMERDIRRSLRFARETIDFGCLTYSKPKRMIKNNGRLSSEHTRCNLGRTI